MGLLGKVFGGAGTCQNCGNRALSTSDFEAECQKAGFVKDAATGQFKMKVGGLAGMADDVMARLAGQQADMQAAFNRIEDQRGYQCKGCHAVYCMNCLFTAAPAHPRGGKACPKCGDTFKQYD